MNTKTNKLKKFITTTNLIIKFLTISTILNNGEILVNGQFSSLGKMQSYGSSGSSGGGGGAQGNSVVTNGGSTGGSTSSNGGSGSSSSNSPGSGEVMNPRSLPLIGEPTCEELRAMWRFSKRQSRASEITNEIPTYRDPFTYNVWLPYYPTTRSLAGPRMVPKYRDPNLPVFGRVVNEPLTNQMTRFGSGAVRSRPHIYGDQRNAEFSIQGRRGQFRSGGGPSVGPGSNYLTTHHGKFRELKELVLTERAKELAQQRRNEEMAARAAVLKEIANGQRFINMQRPSYHVSSPFSAENRSPDQEDDEDHNDSTSKGNNGATGFAPRTIFSGNPASNSGRSGGVLIPSMANSRGIVASGSELPETGIISQPGRSKWPSHFRERNRALFRQAGTPTDFYQRDLRSPLLTKSAYPLTYQQNFNLHKNNYDLNPIRNSLYNLNFDENDDEDNSNNDDNNKINTDDNYINNNNNNNVDDSNYSYDLSILGNEYQGNQFNQKSLSEIEAAVAAAAAATGASLRMDELQQIRDLTELLQQHKKEISKEFLNRLFYNNNRKINKPNFKNNN
ncbi:bromodomain-containing protein DDB_G0270170 [Condylostylus longicornis]|uniref:bromodomain-containing protein DDB_G0270170 n=1 Tax=Condylostylus longicornis TaxID=2530218 RepID=UPI00244DB93F|nr:bromodomain-containing protein DDB_G0270170 [Condylostylus longicornis]